jgi:adenylyl- and sulfurtransferase ThiI
MPAKKFTLGESKGERIDIAPAKRTLTKEEQDIINQTKILEKRENIPAKQGVVLTGGIDSAVMLSQVKRKGSNLDIQPIAFDDSNAEAIKAILDQEGISESVKTFTETNTKAGKKEVLQYCFENNISPLHFGTNYEEYENNLSTKEMQEWRQLSSETNNYGVVISEPLAVINKGVIITLAHQYGLLPLTAKPSDSPRYKKLREKGFADANSQIYKAEERILDPHEEPETEKQ